MAELCDATFILAQISKAAHPSLAPPEKHALLLSRGYAVESRRTRLWSPNDSVSIRSSQQPSDPRVELIESRRHPGGWQLGGLLEMKTMGTRY